LSHLGVELHNLCLVTAGAHGRTAPTYAHMPMRSAKGAPMTEEESIPAHCEVELDIFSGMPNPAWVLTNAEADSLVKQLLALERISAREMSGNLGYRGFIVHCTQGTITQVVRIQHGIVHIAENAIDVYAYDRDRETERWLLNTGKPHVKNELFQIAERELR
jgi:hypothetical protein